MSESLEVSRFGRGLKPLRPVIASDWLHSVRQWAAGNADDSASDWLMSRRARETKSALSGFGNVGLRADRMERSIDKEHGQRW